MGIRDRGFLETPQSIFYWNYTELPHGRVDVQLQAMQLGARRSFEPWALGRHRFLR